MNYFSAEIRRLATRAPRIIALLVLFVLTAFAVILATTIGNSGPIDDYTFVRRAAIVTRVAFILGVGLIEFIFIYDDASKAGLYPAAVGSGFSRVKVLMFQWLEYAVVVAVDVLLGMGILLVSGVLIGASFDSVTLYQMFAIAFTAFLMIVCFATFALVGISITGSTLVGVVVYLAVSVVPIFLMAYVPELPFDVQNVLYYTALEKLSGYFLSAKVDWMDLFLVLLYIVASLGISVAVFRKKELL